MSDGDSLLASAREWRKRERKREVVFMSTANLQKPFDLPIINSIGSPVSSLDKPSLLHHPLSTVNQGGASTCQRLMTAARTSFGY